MKQALIFFNGNLSTQTKGYEFDVSQSFIICADGGTDYALRNNIVPDIVIGDFDSIDPVVLASLPDRTVMKKYPREKDNTDGELAIQEALKHDVSKLIIMGVLGDRIDHLSANLMYLAHMSENIEILVVEKDQEIHFVSKQIMVKGTKGDELSLIPLKDDCLGVTTEGLQYPLKNEKLPFGSTRGISNVFKKANVIIQLKKGRLMVVHRILSELS